MIVKTKRNSEQRKIEPWLKASQPVDFVNQAKQHHLRTYKIGPFVTIQPRTTDFLEGLSSGVTNSQTHRQPGDFREEQSQQISVLDAETEVIGGETAQTEIQVPLEGQAIALDQDKYLYDFYACSNHLSEYEECALHSKLKISVKGRLKKNIFFWKSIHTSKTILETISQGYKIPFIETPAQAIFQNNKTALLHAEFVEESINDLIESGAVKECCSKPHVVSPLSVSINAKGKKRLILDLRYINSHLYKDPIRFDDWRAFENYLVSDSFCFKFDLKSGYHHVDIFHEHQTFLGFSWAKDGNYRYFVFTVLPFGLSTAPYIFTKVLRLLVSFWHSRGIKITLYLDDGIGIESSYEEAKENSFFVRKTLSEAGLVFNSEKSQWSPVKALTWLGITVDLYKNLLFIPNERIISILSLAENLLRCPYTSARTLAKFAGKIMSTHYVVGNIVRLKTRFLYNMIDGRSSWDAKLNLFNFPRARDEIIFWHINLQSLNKKILKSIEQPQKFIFTDASSTGLGAILSGSLECHKNFSRQEREKSSTWREMRAISYALNSFIKLITNRSVLCHTDNYAASRIVAVGSSNLELQDLALSIFQICSCNGIDLKVIWIPRETNIAADKLSKYVDVDDWQLSPNFFAFLSKKWGPFTIDRFADNENAKLKRFNSKYACPNTEACNAFSQNWENENNLFVPPISEIPRVIKRLKVGHVRGVLVFPYWKSSSFWPLLVTQDGVFEDFVSDHLFIENGCDCLREGTCPFSFLTPNNFRGSFVALKIH